MAYLDLHEGVLAEFAERGEFSRDAWDVTGLTVYSLLIGGRQEADLDGSLGRRRERDRKNKRAKLADRPEEVRASKRESYERMRADPVRWAAFLEKRATYKRGLNGKQVPKV